MTKEKSKNRKMTPKIGRRRVGIVNYPVGDFITRVKNASLARKHTLEVTNIKLVKAVADVMKKSGYFDEVVLKDKKLFVRISYRKKDPVIMDMSIVSKPGLRIYMGASELEKIRGPWIYIISTPEGVVSSMEAIKRRLGGEVIAKVL